MTVEFEDQELTESIARSIRLSPPFPKKRLSQIDLLIVKRAHSLAGIGTLKNLKKLSVEKSPIRILSFIPECQGLERLTIRRSLLEDISGVKALSSCHTFEFMHTRVEELAPLLEAESAMIINVMGNPLSDESYRDVLPKLEESALEVTYDSEEVWQLNRRLDELGLPAAFSSHYEDGHQLVPLTDELQFSQTRLVYAVISPDELAAELDKPQVDLAELVERYKPEREKKKSVWDDRERGSAEKARSWIAEADLSDELRASMTGFVERFEPASFVRESDELLDYFARARGAARHDVRRTEVEFPGWVKTWRKTLAWAESQDGPSCFITGQADLADTLEHDGPLAFSVRPFGRKNSDFAQALINRHRAFPIGYAGPEAQLGLAVDLGEGSDDTIYIFRTSDVYRWDFNPFEYRLFDGLSAMFDAVDELGDADGCAPGDLGDFPPKVEFDFDAHVDSGDAARAKARIKESSLSARLTDVLSRFIDGFPGLTYLRDTEASLQYYEVINGARLPQWYRRLRKTLGFAQSNGQPVDLFFGGWRVMKDEPFGFGSGQVYYDIGRKLIGEYNHYPVLNSPQYFLTIRLDDHDDDTVYWSDVDEVARDKFAPASKYTSAAKMFDAVTAIRASDETIERG